MLMSEGISYDPALQQFLVAKRQSQDLTTKLNGFSAQVLCVQSFMISKNFYFDQQQLLLGSIVPGKKTNKTITDVTSSLSSACGTDELNRAI